MDESKKSLEDIKFKFYSSVLYLGILITIVIWITDRYAGAITPVSNIFLPFFALIAFVFAFILRRGNRKYIRFFEIFVFCLVVIYLIYFYGNEITIGFHTGSLDLQKYLLWMVVIYALPFVVFTAQRALKVSLGLYAIIAAAGATFLVLSPKHVDFIESANLVFQILLSNLLYIGFFSIILQLQDKMRDIENRSDILYSLAHTDMLTGINNRRKITDTLNFLIQQIGPFSIVLLDIDNFKTINDSKGHEAGDRVLVDFGKELRNSVRENDIVGRWGGDEFMIISNAPEEAQTYQLARRIQNNLANRNQPAVSYSFSFGVSAFKPGDTLEKLLSRADADLYEQKKQKIFPQ